MYGPYELDIGGIEEGHIRRKTKEEKKYHDALGEHLIHFHNDYELFRKIVKALYPEAKETDIQKYGVKISASGSRSKGFGIWIEGYGKHAEQVPAWEYPKLSLFYRLLTALTAMKHNLDVEDAYRALSVELPKRLGHKVPKPEEIQEVEKTVNELVQEGLLPERAKQDVIDLAKELSQIVYEAFPTKESLLEHDKNIVKQIRKDRSWGVKNKGLGEYWYEVVLEDVLKKHSKKVTEIMKRGIKQPSLSAPLPQELPSEHIPEPLAGVFKALGDKIKPDEMAIIELRLTLAGEMTLEELSEKWERYGFSLLELLKKEGALREAFREAVEEFRKAGFGVLPVPREVLPLIENPELETVTAARLFYSALESVAVRGLPEKGEEIIELVTGILERVPAFSPYVEEIPEELERSAETLAKTLALMKDGSYLEVLEAELAPLLEKVPETRKVGLFKRDSPRRKVEDFAALLMEGNLDEDEAERKAGELREYLKSHLASEEVEKLVAGLMLPFRARKLLEKRGTAEGFLFEYAHSMASRMLHLEGLLAVGSKPRGDELARLFAFLPGTEGTVEVPLEKLRDNLKLL